MSDPDVNQPNGIVVGMVWLLIIVLLMFSAG